MLIHLKSWIKTSRHPMVSHTSSLVIIFCLLLLKAVGGSGKASSLMCTTGVPVVSQTSDSRWKCRLSASRGGSIIYAISAAPWRRDLRSLNGSFMLSHPFRLLLLCTASRFTEITRSMSFKLFCLRALWPTCKLLSPKAFWCEPLLVSDLDIMDPVFMCRCGPYYSYRVERLCILGKDQKLYKQHLSNLTIASWLAVSTEPKLNWGILWWQAWTHLDSLSSWVLTCSGLIDG